MANVDIFKDIKEYYKDKKLQQVSYYEWSYKKSIVHILNSTYEEWFIDLNKYDYYEINIAKECIYCSKNNNAIFPDEIKK